MSKDKARIIELQRSLRIAKTALEKIQYCGHAAPAVAENALEEMRPLEKAVIDAYESALAVVPPAPPSKQFTPQQAANLKAAFADEGIPWPNIKINARGAHLSELLQQCVDAFEEDGGDLDHAYRLLGYTREILQWRLRGADGERPAPPSTPERDKLLEALKVGLTCARNLCQLGNYFSREVDQIESAIAALEGKS